jgi:lysophospholipase L1-like esterase
MNLKKVFKEIVGWLFAIAISFIVIIVIIDIGYYFLKPSIYTNNPKLGWELRPNLQRTFTQHSLSGDKYTVDFKTNNDGVRTFGTNINAPNRILVLGDSFTGEPTASNDKMWFAEMTRILAKQTHTPADQFYVWAAGAGGYGTYQNLLLTKRLLSKIKPTLVVLQFCTNDFTNNHFEWESLGIVRNQSMRRPYANPSNLNSPVYDESFLGKVFRSMLGESKIFNTIDSIIQKYEFKTYGGYSRPMTNLTLMRLEKESVLLTSQILTALRAQFLDVPSVMVNCAGDTAGLNGQWTEIATKAGFIPISEPSNFLLNAKHQHNKAVFNRDGAHLSELGNLQFGEILADAMIKHHIFPK